MRILDAVPPEGSEITVVQLRLAPLSFTHWNSSRFLESFNYVIHCWRWNIQISSYLSWGTLFLNISIIFSRICWQTGDPRPIFAPKGLDLSWMLLLYKIIITITCWHQLFQITSLFNQFTSLLALNCSCPNFFWNVLQVWMTGKDVYLQMTWSWPDKTWNILCSYCLQWNTSQSKFRNHYFLFFICVFHTVPTFSDLGLYIYIYVQLKSEVYIHLAESLMLQKEKRYIKSRGVKTFEQNADVNIFLILPKYHIFSFSTALQKPQKILTSFPENKIT